METKWTDGPWNIDGPDCFGDFNILCDGDALAIAAVVSNMRPADEVAANAYLLGAAKKLYAEAERSRIALESAAALLGASGCPTHAKTMREQADALAKVLAKARGES